LYQALKSASRVVSFLSSAIDVSFERNKSEHYDIRSS
jgi:hypothetical protein